MTVKINARFVKQMLLERDMDQQGLAGRAAGYQKSPSALMQGRPFTSETLGKIAKALDCHPVDLIDAKGYATPHLVASPA